VRRMTVPLQLRGEPLGELHVLERISTRLDEIDRELISLEKMVLIASVEEAATCLRAMNDLRKEQRLLNEVRSSLLETLKPD
jgi:hypothetical protein